MRNNPKKKAVAKKIRSEQTEKAVNMFLVCHAKDLLKIEIGLHFKTVNKFTACWYIYEGNVLISEVKRKGLNSKTPTSDIRSLPPGYVSFSRRMWDKMEDFVFTKAHLDKLVKAISIFGKYDRWEDFEKKYENHEGKIWADQIIGTWYEELTSEQSLNLQLHRHNSVQLEYSELKFSGKISIHSGDILNSPKKTPVYYNSRYCLRIALEKDFERIKTLPFHTGVILKNSSERLIYFSNYAESFFIVEDLSDQVVGSICIQFCEESDLSNTITPLNNGFKHKAKSFFIRELLFINNSIRDFVLTNLKLVLKKISGIKMQEEQICIYIYSSADFGHILSDFGFIETKRDSDKIMYKSNLFSINEILNFKTLKKINTTWNQRNKKD